MGREVMRVPLSFDWPLNKVWEGYTHPEKFREDECPDCTQGLTKDAQRLYDKFYGNAPFDPSEVDSEPYTDETPVIRRIAERNVERAPGYYGTGEDAIRYEGRRLAGIYNGQWGYHLSQEDVDALVARERGLGRLTHDWIKGTGYVRKDPPVHPTAAEINEGRIADFLGDGRVEAYEFVEMRCEREGITYLCPTCDGQGSLERYEGQRAEAEKWEREDPPKGEGWQLWETVSEGSPISPVFPEAEGLAQWMASPQYRWGAVKNRPPMSIEAARAFVQSGWAPSMVFTPEKGLQDGATFIGEQDATKVIAVDVE